MSVKTHAHEAACGVSNITLNGAYLPQEWNGDFAHGSGYYSGVTDISDNAWFLQHDLDLEWESACLHGEQETDDAAQVLTVNIKSIDGKALSTPYPGFTLSFKQASPPELLRLQSTPDLLASTRERAESWRHPPSNLRLVIPKKESVGSTATPDSAGLEDDIRELRALEAEAQKLQDAIAGKKKYIKSQIKQKTQNFKGELRDCDNITCIVKTIADGAHGAWSILLIHFRPGHSQQDHNSSSMGRPEDDAYHRVWRAGSHQQGNIKVEATAAQSSPSPSETPQPSNAHHGAPRMPPPESPFVIAIEIVLGVLCCGCIVTVIRNRCCSARTRVERAAAREERRTRNEYRRAARRHAWSKWWRGNWRDQQRVEDYEEKRSLIQHQESILEDAMQEEIRQLRAVHGVVNDLVSQAEEGRVVTYPHNYCSYSRSHPVPQAPYSPLSTASTYPPTSLPEVPSRPLSRTDSLPGYRSDTSSRGAPPAYEEDEDVSDSVANGFRHYSSSMSTTSGTSSRWTPDSSIVDVSPRPSADTLRRPDMVESLEYAECTETGVGDAKN